MEIAVGSKRGPKVNATRAAFTDAFAPHKITVFGFEVESGVSSHPVTAEETLLGALNRIRTTREQLPSADYYVGIEGGLQPLQTPGGNTVFFETDFVVIEDNAGARGYAHSVGVEVRGRILDAILAGREMSEVIEEVHGIEAVGSANGFSGLTTNELVTREDIYYDAVAHALGPFLHPEYFS